MRKILSLLIIVFAVLSCFAQKGPIVRDQIQMEVNTITVDETRRINDYISNQKRSRFLLETWGKNVLTSAANGVSNLLITEAIRLTSIRKTKKANWSKMIEKECNYVDNISFVNSLTDFYSKGSFDGPLDPADINFNGFTIIAQNNGRELLRFYSHVATDEAGLDKIFNQSKFDLVIDSLFYHPFNCHIPNLRANNIVVNQDKQYGRNISFSFDERNNLMLNIRFTIIASWYNEAVMLAKDVELGSFNIQIPISQERLTDSVFVYKRGVSADTLSLSGDCFIVPRSYMPLSGGVAHWGTGQYNVMIEFSEHCGITAEVRDNWKHDYRQLKRMSKNKETGQYLLNICKQNGNIAIKAVIESTSKSALSDLDNKAK